MTVRYWIAKHVSDPFRNEPQNVGVIVDVDGTITARFLGEDGDGELDGRSIRHRFQFPDVYKQWVRYWRKESAKGSVAKLIESNAANFRMYVGGEVGDVGGDSPQQVASYLFSLLVSEKGYSEAIAPDENTESTQPGLDTELSAAFKDVNILASDSGLVPHPIRTGVPVLGRASATYTPAFVQENGHLVMIETVDFTKSSRRGSRDHAGWSAYMFHDVRKARQDVEPIAVVRLTNDVAETEEVRNGLSILKSEGSVVNWLEHDERSRFLDARRALAYG